jgi:hypothetical protein
MWCCLCRPAVAPQVDLGAPTSPSQTRSAEPKVVGEALADDARTATPPRGAVESRATSPLVADAKVETPPHVVDVGGVTSIEDVGATTSPTVIDVDPSVWCLVGLRTWSGTSLKLTWRQEVQEHLARRYLSLRLQARGCHGGQLTGITALSRRTGLRITRTCRPCEPASLPSIPRW